MVSKTAGKVVKFYFKIPQQTVARNDCFYVSRAMVLTILLDKLN